MAVLPSLFTLGNCICGFASLHYAALPSGTQTGIPGVSPYSIAGYLIFASRLFDLLDGFVARLVRATSDFGAELDSLADMVSFGVAPAFLTLELIGDMLSADFRPPGVEGPFAAFGPGADSAMGKLFWIIAALYVACTALRLARFNVFNKHDVEAHQSFRGLPSPGAAGVVVSTVIFFEMVKGPRHYLWSIPPAGTQAMVEKVFPYLMPAILLLAALLMVSRFQYAHLVNRFFRGRRRFRYVVGVVFVVALVAWQPQMAALLAIYVYALSAPVGSAWRKVFPKKEAAGGPPAGGAGGAGH